MRKKVLIIAFALLILLFCFSSAYAEERVVKYDMTFVATQPDILLKLKGDAVDWMEILPNTNYALIKVKIDGRMVTCYGFSDAFAPKR
jgi:hypothetical protein